MATPSRRSAAACLSARGAAAAPLPGRRPATGRRPAKVLVATSVAIVSAIAVAGCGGSYTVTPAPTRSSAIPGSQANAGRPDAGPAVPASGAYLGAWLHPSSPRSGSSSFAVEQASVSSVLAATGRPLGLLHIYAPWARPVPVAELRSVVGDGSVPILDWGCGPDVSRLAGGGDDSVITAYATALKKFAGPVFLRWCWEMNLVSQHVQVGGPAGFTSAWDHIRTIFRTVGATNVSFVWCPALQGVDPTPYYPGPSEVDWIGVDGYDRTGTQTFGSLFRPFATAWQGQGKPMMVGETGSSGPAQAGFIDSISADAPSLPDIKAVAYFDAPGPKKRWQFTPAGLAAFGRLAKVPYFHPD